MYDNWVWLEAGSALQDIVKSLAMQGFMISQRHWSRLLRVRSLHRWRYNLEAGGDFIVDQLHGFRKDHSYQRIYTRCKQYCVSVWKEDVSSSSSSLTPSSTWKISWCLGGAAAPYDTNVLTTYTGTTKPRIITGSGYKVGEMAAVRYESNTRPPV